ncbi:hypothetical protein NCCP28_14450 [Niallia sp. NCCP-28]|nr:hypothetical protein NCCP28_14450 [Niallia sp. NCCP-28]
MFFSGFCFFIKRLVVKTIKFKFPKQIAKGSASISEAINKKIIASDMGALNKPKQKIGRI